MSDYKRLTKRAENGEPYFDGCLSCDLKSDCGLCPYWESGINRLAELEDKIERGELVENNVITHFNMARSNSKTLIQKALWYDELKAKIEQGTLIELPCKIGDTFWYLSVAGYIEEDKIANFSLYGEFFTGERVVTKLYRNYLGRTWFLTREEAEKRLKELQDA